MSKRPQLAKLISNKEQNDQVKFKAEPVREDLTYKFQKDKNKKLRVFSDGVYDCMHYGHMNQLKQIKDMFPDCHLIVGVSCQNAVLANKGPTILEPHERVLGVEATKWADEIYYPCPWELTEEFLNKLDIDVVCHDSAPYAFAGGEDMYAVCKKMGKFQETQRTEGVSTSDIVLNILANREYFFFQLLEEGKTRDDLGLSLYQYLKLKIKYNLQKIICPSRNKNFKRPKFTH